MGCLVAILMVGATAQAQYESEGAARLTAPEPRGDERAALAPVPPPPDPQRIVGYPPPRAEPAVRHRSGSAIVWEILGGMAGWALGVAPVLLGATPLLLPVSLPLGITSGITLGGHASGGDGSFWAVFGWQALGGLASIPFVLVGDPILALAAVIVLPIIGGVVGYEKSNTAGYAPGRPAGADTRGR